MTLTFRIILVLLGLAYLISPYDLIPDLLVPFLGWLDDGMVLWCIYHLIRYGDLPWFLFKRPGRPIRTKQKPSGNRPGTSGPAPQSGKEENDGAGADGETRETDPTSPYDILGVSKTSSWAEIQKAYKERIKQYHPDKLSHLGEEFSSLANEKFLAIQAAYARIKAERRKK